MTTSDHDQSDRRDTVTRLLQDLDGAELRRAEELLPLVYDELRALAQARMARESSGHTLQATALVHEAYMRLVGNNDPGWNGKGHFFGAAALAMRRILVEKARHKKRQKRGGDWNRITLDGLGVGIDSAEPDVIALDEIARRLEDRDPRKGTILNLRLFAGFTNEETATAMGLSVATIEREWRFIKTWIAAELERQETEGTP